jgi:hypothetical protein
LTLLCESQCQALQLASTTSGAYTSRARLDIIELIRLAIRELLGAAIIRTNGPNEMSTTRTKRMYKGDERPRTKVHSATERQYGKDEKSAEVDQKVRWLSAGSEKVLPPVPKSARNAQAVRKRQQFDRLRIAKATPRLDGHRANTNLL